MRITPLAAPLAVIAVLALVACGSQPADSAAESAADETATESMPPPPPAPGGDEVMAADSAEAAAAPPGAEPSLDRGLPVCPGDPRCKK